jgi:2-dehydro-3-deoxyphosphogluconate aldolase / (4S)-4-hydroxy-2-oxoglutarate aldolase
MNIEQSWKRIGEVGIVPVVRAANAAEAQQAVKAIHAGGISVVEITMTVPKAPNLIRDLVREYGEKLLVGAGTVLTYEQASECLDAGAEFLVSPGLSLPVLKAAEAQGKLAIPGALTPSEVMSATREGARLVKIFPCESLGGPKYIKALKGPFPQVDLIPTGGVSLLNAGDYFAAGSYALGIGSELVDLKALRSGRSQDIADYCGKLREVVSRDRQARKIPSPV